MLQMLRDEPHLRRAFYGLTAEAKLSRFRPDVSVAMRKNRDTLSSVPTWISDQTYANSIFQYGLPEYIRPFIDEPACDEPNYADLIVTLALRFPSLSYLELGPSVGKTFLQVARAVSNAQLVGLDIEDINPTLAAQFEQTGRAEWATMPTSMRKRQSVQSTYRLDANKIDYVAGDIFDPATWARIEGRKFNLIFSDAFHSPDALLTEWRSIQDRNLLADGPFAVVWDDLTDKGMRGAFYNIAKQIQAFRSAAKVSLELYHGWVGKRERQHPIGIVRHGI